MDPMPARWLFPALLSCRTLREVNVRPLHWHRSAGALVHRAENCLRWEKKKSQGGLAQMKRLDAGGRSTHETKAAPGGKLRRTSARPDCPHSTQLDGSHLAVCRGSAAHCAQGLPPGLELLRQRASVQA
jgi:hypothetical protein